MTKSGRSRKLKTELGGALPLEKIMKKTIPQKEVEVCDYCGRDGYLVTCIFCNGRFCLSHGKAIIAGCVHQVPVCQKCGENETVLEIVYRHAPLIDNAIQKRDAEIRKASQHRVKSDVAKAQEKPSK